MKLPRVRFTVRRMMVAVALAAFATGGWRWYWEGRRCRMIFYTTPQDGRVAVWFDMGHPVDAARCLQIEGALRAQKIRYRVQHLPNRRSPLGNGS